MRFFFTTLFLLLFTLIFSGSLQAQQLSERWVCLNPIYCAANPTQCSGGLTPIQLAHSVRLAAKADAKPLPNAETYILECFANTEKRTETCTSGDAATDQKIFKVNNVAKLASSMGYKFEGLRLVNKSATLTQPRLSNSTGDLEALEWRSATTNMEARKFLALNYFSDSNTDGQGGQQQGTPTFETAAKNCVSINWDPYGRVFDALSLEPIPNASVQLQKKRETGLFSMLLPSEILGGSVINPYLTKADGGFSFVVPDGTYKLLVSHPSYSFPVQLAQIAQAFTSVYANIYPAQTGVDIVQKGKIEHRDIPLLPRGAPKTYPVELVEYFYTVDKLSNQIVLEGRASHPFTTIKVWTQKVDPVSGRVTEKARMVAMRQTDAEGKFKMFISQQGFALNESFGSIELIKREDLAGIPVRIFTSLVERVVSYLAPNISAQNTTTLVTVDPILTYIEGYAYDTAGRVLPSAKVGVYLTFSESPYFQTTADSKGYFKITSENLPSMQFVLRYTSPQGQNTVTTTGKFTSQNVKFVSTNKVNLNRYKDASGQAAQAPDTQDKDFDGFAQSKIGYVPQDSKKEGAQATTPGNSFLLVGLVLLSLLTVAGVVLGVYVMRRRRLP